MTVIEIVSFGYLHGAPPEGAHLTLDLRRHFRDPHVNPALREMNAFDEEVREAVLSTPGIAALVAATVRAVLAFHAGPVDAPVRIAVGCAGGRHRAPTFAGAVAEHLFAIGYNTRMSHRDLAKPVVQREAVAC
ncbi:ATPase [Kitasatospora sp. NPDC096147]|uniref:RapZ C-terminal domain-containing protein n=1 Tax=Kitasatospora sp. NPDC096147 TaxID=3364093 RepID=UPI00382A9721